MNVVVFGGSGKAGSAIAERGLDRGDSVTAFSRTVGRLGPLAGRPGLRVLTGDASDPQAVEAALVGQDAVLSALGAGTLEPTTYLHDITHVVVDAMRDKGPRRLIVISHVGVLLKKVAPEYQHVAEEHRRNLALLEGSDLDWTAVCPPGIADEPAQGHVEATAGARAPNWTISRFDLADFMLDQIGSDRFSRVAVGVSN
jgi:putative NADH-flavin reductase